MIEYASAELDSVFHALADPTRRALLFGLREGERSVGELAAPYPISLAAVSKHLGVLAEANLISRTRHGRQVRCRLEPDALAAASAWIEHYREFWTARLETLDQLLNQERKSDGR
ncbi:MAG: metalloregulator ArsR/SmtB family transcription factor [Actinomycetota bacterium]